MAITPWTQGNLSPAWKMYMVPDSGYTDITGLATNNFSLRIRALNTGNETSGAGTFSNITAAIVVNGVATTHASVQYQPVSGDVSTTGNRRLYLDVTFVNGIRTFDLGIQEIDAL